MAAKIPASPWISIFPTESSVYVHNGGTWGSQLQGFRRKPLRGRRRAAAGGGGSGGGVVICPGAAGAIGPVVYYRRPPRSAGPRYVPGELSEVGKLAEPPTQLPGNEDSTESSVPCSAAGSLPRLLKHVMTVPPHDYRDRWLGGGICSLTVEFKLGYHCVAVLRTWIQHTLLRFVWFKFGSLSWKDLNVIVFNCNNTQ